MSVQSALIAAVVAPLMGWLALWSSPFAIVVWHDHIGSFENDEERTKVAACLYFTGRGVVSRFYYSGEGCLRVVAVGYSPVDEGFDEKKAFEQ